MRRNAAPSTTKTNSPLGVRSDNGFTIRKGHSEYLFVYFRQLPYYGNFRSPVHPAYLSAGNSADEVPKIVARLSLCSKRVSPGVLLFRGRKPSKAPKRWWEVRDQGGQGSSRSGNNCNPDAGLIGQGWKSAGSEIRHSASKHNRSLPAPGNDFRSLCFYCVHGN